MYPNLSRMARDYLAVSATGVPVEALFSTGTDLLDDNRLSMAAETVRACMCLKAWGKEKKTDSALDRMGAIIARMSGKFNK